MNEPVKWKPQPERRRDWRLKLIEATKGNQSLMGCIVLAAIGKGEDRTPGFRGKAVITNRNEVLCDFVDSKGYHVKARISDDEDLVRNIVGLAYHCDLNDEERTEFLARVNAWIWLDERPKTRIERVMLT